MLISTYKIREKSIPFIVFAFSIFFALPLSVLGAAQYTPLVGIPGVPTAGTLDLPGYLNRIYMISIGVGALIAVAKMVMAGIKYSLSGIVTDKADAKSDIKGALLGLAILLVPFIVLSQIYPDLTNLNILRNAGEKTSLTTTTPEPPAGAYGSMPEDPNTKELTITQGEFDTYSETNIYAWFERCGGADNFKVAAETGGQVKLYCSTP